MSCCLIFYRLDVKIIAHVKIPCPPFSNRMTTRRWHWYAHILQKNSGRRITVMIVGKEFICLWGFSSLYQCNSLLVGLPKNHLEKLQIIQNNAARLFFSLLHYVTVSPLPEALRWFPVSKRIYYKLSCLSHSGIAGTGPQYLNIHYYF